MEQGVRPSICYIVPSYTRDDASHMAHLPRFLSEVGKTCDIHIIIQRGSGHPTFPNVRSVYVQRSTNHIQRALELILYVYRLRCQGCRKVFIRISVSAAFELSIVSRLLNLQVYYWLSGQAENLKPAWRGSFRQRAIFELSQMLQTLNAKIAYRFVTGPETMVSYYKQVLRINENKMVLLYNDIDLPCSHTPAESRTAVFSKSHLNLPQDSELVLFVGRVSPLKGGHNLIPLAEKLRSHRPQATLLVVGQLDHLPDIPRRAQERGLTNMLFLGPVANHKIARYFLAADVLVLPSESEGFPRVLLEAMGYGVPVVAFDVGGVRDIVHPEQLPFVVQRGDIEGMAHHVTQILGNPVLRARLALLGRHKVRQYSTEAVARMFIERIVLG